MTRSARLAVLVAGLVSCSGGSRSGRVEHGVVGGAAIARVGDVSIAAELVERVAVAQSTTPAEALDRLIDDAVADQSARKRQLDQRPHVAWALRTALARRTTETLSSRARDAGLPNDAELEQATARRWREFDVPEGVRVIHAVVLSKQKGTGSGLEVAQRLRAAVASSQDAASFEKSAKAVDAQGWNVTVEQLPAFAKDGRSIEGAGGFDATFVVASFATSVGETSAVVETPFGWHVIRALERVPARSVPRDERRIALAADVRQQRVRAAIDAMLARQRSTLAISIEPAAEELMASVHARAPEP